VSGPDSKLLDSVSFLDKCEGQQRTEFCEVAKLWPLHIQIKELSPVPPRDAEAEGEFPVVYWAARLSADRNINVIRSAFPLIL